MDSNWPVEEHTTDSPSEARTRSIQSMCVCGCNDFHFFVHDEFVVDRVAVGAVNPARVWPSLRTGL